jgi:hypothetical protein
MARVATRAGRSVVIANCRGTESRARVVVGDLVADAHVVEALPKTGVPVIDLRDLAPSGTFQQIHPRVRAST